MCRASPTSSRRRVSSTSTSPTSSRSCRAPAPRSWASARRAAPTARSRPPSSPSSRRCSRRRSRARTACCCRSRAGRTSASSRSTTPRSWSRRPRTPRRTSSSERSSTTRSATRCGSPSSRPASTAASRRCGSTRSRRRASSRRPSLPATPAERRGDGARCARVEPVPVGAAVPDVELRLGLRRRRPRHPRLPQVARRHGLRTATAGAAWSLAAATRRRSTRGSRMPHARRAAIRRELTRIVVTKFHPASLVERALRARRARRRREPAAGVQREGRRRSGALPGLRWHFIGQAQTNKARAIRAAASVVHSIDRARLADALDAAGAPGEPRARRAAAGQPHRRPGPRRRRARPSSSARRARGRMPHPARCAA